jgi:SAM-dependent methyltransferase
MPSSEASQRGADAKDVAWTLRRGSLPDEEWRKAGLFLIDLLSGAIGREDLSGVDLLDVGCGTLIVQTLLGNSLPIGHYAGVDVSPEVIAWLEDNVTDPRFEFHVLDAHNSMYNPDGKPLADFDLLPVGPRRFDLISLFSVFTHLAPGDYVAMLRLLRRHVKEDGTLLFSLFLADPKRPNAYAVAVKEQLASDDPEVRATAKANLEKAQEARRQSAAAGYDPRFVDEVPGDPLQRARYTEDYAIELFDGTGWAIEGIHPPHPKGYIQHYMICKPV